jgi:hypothetical protein
MSGATTLRELQPEAGPQPLACRLRYKKSLNRLGQPFANHGEVELENLSATPLEIRYRMTALQYLNLVVTTADGTVMSEGHFGDRFAPTLEPAVLRLEPGEKFTADVHLFATIRIAPIPPGSYSVQAVYAYNGFRAVSDPLVMIVSNA